MQQPVKTDAPTEILSVAQPGDEAAAIISLIERAATNPAVDIDKMERLFKMHDAVLARRAKAAFIAAKAEMQPKLPIIDENGQITNRNGDVQSTYALWEDINDAITPILTEHGFNLSFRGSNTIDLVTTTAVLAHIGGHTEETSISLPIDMSGSKNGVQGVGSSKSYGKRYAAIDILNITSKKMDDDGAGAVNNKSSMQAKKDGLWKEVCDALEACATERALNKETNAYKLKVPKSWLGSLAEKYHDELLRIKQAAAGLDRQ